MDRPPGVRTDLYADRRGRPSKLTGAQRDEIKRRLVEGEMPKPLALEFKVSAGLIRSLR